ncbi:MAG: Pycsar system effector family protein, partial [Saprospiraceae bacterium]
YAPVVAENIRNQKSKVEKSKASLLKSGKDEDGNLRMYQQIGPKNSGGGIQTFFRTNYRNHINLSAIADNKANIMISVNAILISVIISMLSYRNISQTQPMVLLPVVIFLVTGLSSLICAVLSIRPKVTSKHEGLMEMEEAKKNVVFFGNFIHLDLEQYEEAMDAVLRDGELLYGNMVRDLYFLGKVLDKKYRYLTMSYNIFMVGFVATVITFLIAIFS